MLPFSTAHTAGSRVARRRSSESGALRLCFALGLFFQMPSFVLQMSEDPVLLRVLQLGNFLCFILGAIVILSSPNPKKILFADPAPMLMVGVGLLSSLWSLNPSSTYRAVYILLGTTLFSLAMCVRLSPASCVQLIIRMMSFVCLLSAICAVFFPNTGVHPPTDHVQEHIGLWRGVFSHKQGLGVVSGLTAGLLMFYGSLAFPLVIIRIGALGAAFACLIGSQSVTGLLIALTSTTFLYTTYGLTRSSGATRRTALRGFIALLVVFYLAFHFDLLNFVMPLLGKSEDLTGRADFWPYVIGNLRETAPLVGGGFAGGLEEDVAPGMSIDNGFIVELVDFGYLGGAVILAAYARSLWGSVKVILSARPEEAAIRVFPLNVMLIELIIGISETNFMSKSINWVIVIVSMYQVAQYLKPIPSTSAARRETTHPRSLRGASGPAYRRSED
jgi:hypothetical protein